MTDEKKDKPDEGKEKKNKIDKELEQTFPASDPPSRTRPGHKRKHEDESEKE